MNNLADWPLLTLLLASPVVGAMATALLRRRRWVHQVALASALLTLALSLLIVAAFDRANAGFQLVDAADWIPGINVRYLVGVDGLALLFLPATALLFTAAIVASWRGIATTSSLPTGVYFAFLLLLEAATLGVFCALDVIVFLFCWEFTVLPVYFLVSLWGIDNGRQAAAIRYFLIMLAGGVPLLFGLLTRVLVPAGETALHFDLPTLLAAPPAEDVQMLVFLLLFLAFAVKVPIVPLHTWLPPLAMSSPVAVTAALVGLKIGAFGLLRVAIPLAPLAARELHWLLAGVGTVAVLYGGVAALAQSNLRGVLAYTSVSHVGLVLLGLASFSVAALQGALLLLFNFSLATGSGFLVLAFLQRRTGSTDLAALGGVVHRMPVLSGFFLLFGVSGFGLPGTAGFPAELLILVEAVHAHTGAGLAALFGTVLAAAAFLAPFRLAFCGPLANPEVAEAADLLPREVAVLLPAALLTLAIGLFPLPLLELLRPAAEAWLEALAGL